VDDIKIRRVEWEGHLIMEDERYKKKSLREMSIKDGGKNKNKMEKHRSEGDITDPRNMRMKETIRRQKNGDVF